MLGGRSSDGAKDGCPQSSVVGGSRYCLLHTGGANDEMPTGVSRGLFTLMPTVWTDLDAMPPNRRNTVGNSVSHPRLTPVGISSFAPAVCLVGNSVSHPRLTPVGISSFAPAVW